jgi:CPA2 family monovalent cation:H+ antiporter-2
VLLGLFFVTIGMALDLRVVIDNIGLGRGAADRSGGGQARAGRRAGAPVRSRRATALRTGFYLAQAGEFALVLLALSTANGLVPQALAQPVLAAMILSMLLAPLVIQHAEAIVRRLTANDWLARAAESRRSRRARWDARTISSCAASAAAARTSCA